MFIRFSRLIFLFISSSLFAAGPITHAYLTDHLFVYFPKYSPEERKAFMVGTLFPDIQYLGESMREDTHWDQISLAEVLEEPSPFLAGVKFHSYVDWVREDFVRAKNMYDFLSDEPNCSPPSLFLKLKLIEDEVIYPFGNWKEWRQCLIEIRKEELEWGIDSTLVRKWHNLLDTCFANPPSTILFLLSITKANCLHISSEKVLEWNKVLKPKASSRQIQEFILALIMHFDTQFYEASRTWQMAPYLRTYLHTSVG